MAKPGNVIMSFVIASIFVIGLPSCEKDSAPEGQKGPAEKAGQQLDQAAARAGEELNRAAEKAGAGLQRFGQKLQNEAQRAQKKNNND